MPYVLTAGNRFASVNADFKIVLRITPHLEKRALREVLNQPASSCGLRKYMYTNAKRSKQKRLLLSSHVSRYHELLKASKHQKIEGLDHFVLRLSKHSS